MKRLALILLLFLPLPAFADPGTPGDAAKYAVVRIPSHGASATVIYTEKGKTFFLGCAHAYEGRDGNGTVTKTKENTVSIPTPTPDKPIPNHPKLIAVDYQLDLSLLQLDYGPLPYSCNVAQPGYKPGRNLLSVGYDEMKWPATIKAATIVADGQTITYTREKPWHGRSGGALLDADSGLLIGVCHGYEVLPNGRGMYVSHAAVCQFLAKHGWVREGFNEVPRQQPQPVPSVPRQSFPQPFRVSPQACPS